MTSSSIIYISNSQNTVISNILVVLKKSISQNLLHKWLLVICLFSHLDVLLMCEMGSDPWCIGRD